MILVSACLAGINCTYKASNNLNISIKQLVESNQAIVVCPEVFGGLETPRTPCEIQGDQVISKLGKDCTKEYQTGALKALEICKENNIKVAILKAKSPSCGKDYIYDGTFSKTLVKGNGICTQLLLEHGIQVFNEDCIEEALKVAGF